MFCGCNFILSIQQNGKEWGSSWKRSVIASFPLCQVAVRRDNILWLFKNIRNVNWTKTKTEIIYSGFTDRSSGFQLYLIHLWILIKLKYNNLIPCWIYSIVKNFTKSLSSLFILVRCKLYHFTNTSFLIILFSLRYENVTKTVKLKLCSLTKWLQAKTVLSVALLFFSVHSYLSWFTLLRRYCLVTLVYPI